MPVAARDDEGLWRHPASRAVAPPVMSMNVPLIRSHLDPFLSQISAITRPACRRIYQASPPPAHTPTRHCRQVQWRSQIQLQFMSKDRIG